MASVFWDAHGILFIDYLDKSITINSDYYMALLDRLNSEIKKKRPHIQKKKVLFHQNNAPCHKSMKTMLKLNELRGCSHGLAVFQSVFWNFTVRKL